MFFYESRVFQFQKVKRDLKRNLSSESQVQIEDQNSSVLNHLPGKQNNILEYKDV